MPSPIAGSARWGGGDSAAVAQLGRQCLDGADSANSGALGVVAHRRRRRYVLRYQPGRRYNVDKANDKARC